MKTAVLKPTENGLVTYKRMWYGWETDHNDSRRPRHSRNCAGVGYFYLYTPIVYLMLKMPYSSLAGTLSTPLLWKAGPYSFLVIEFKTNKSILSLSVVFQRNYKTALANVILFAFKELDLDYLTINIFLFRKQGNTL